MRRETRQSEDCNWIIQSNWSQFIDMDMWIMEALDTGTDTTGILSTRSFSLCRYNKNEGFILMAR